MQAFQKGATQPQRRPAHCTRRGRGHQEINGQKASHISRFFNQTETRRQIREIWRILQVAVYQWLVKSGQKLRSNYTVFGQQIGRIWSAITL